LRELLINKWFLYGVILVVSYLMVSNLRLMALKFKTYAFGPNALKYVLLLASLACIVFLHWLAVPVIFVLYIVLSLANRSHAG